MFSITHEPFRKKLTTVIDRTVGIQAYGADNLYPQRMREVRDGSYTTIGYTDALKRFLSGDGFEDPRLAAEIMNEEGETMNDLLDLIASDKSIFNGYAFHFKYNLKYRISQVSIIDFEFNRFGVPDENAKFFDIKVNNNWERDPYKSFNRGWDIHEYPVFNPDPNVVKAQIDYYGYHDYPGQVLFWTPKRGVYPKCTFDAVVDQAQTQEEIGIFDLSSIQNGFTATTIFKYPGSFDNETERQKFENKLKQHKGARGAKSTLVVENPGREELDLVESLQLQNTDRMFEFVSKNAKNSIRENGTMPAEILGVTPESGMFNKESIMEAYTYYNTITRPSRAQISRTVQFIMQYWKNPVAFSSSKIKEQVYG